mmetsp:Transcript_37799/g.91955  ORF Transcript_37799/g.91955 Transcript_37799/m.91955 type:complete len:406 (+) Transcript_37799:76-1293(+)
MGACEACHTSKVKCRYNSGPPPRDDDDGVPGLRRACDRCIRLDLQCVPHVSKQGKHSKRRKVHGNEQADRNMVAMSVTASASSASRSLLVERQFVKLTSNIAQYGPTHFGINHIIRQWLVLAFSRKSFRLLEMASRLANRVKVSMDQILQVSNLPNHWLPNQESPPNVEQLSLQLPTLPKATPTGPSLELPLSEIPTQVAQAMRCIGKKVVNCPKVCGFNPDGRWLFVRETHHDMVRFFVSNNFARDICELSTIQNVWTSNLHEVKYLWLVDTKDNSYGKTFLRFISQYSRPGEHSEEPIRSNAKKIRLKDGKSFATMDLLYYYFVGDLDHSFMVNELIPPNDFVSPFEDDTAAKEPCKDEKLLHHMFDDFPAFEGSSDEDETDWSWLEDLLTEEDPASICHSLI